MCITTVLVCGLRQIVLGTEEKQQICFLLNRLLLDQRRVVPVCWGFIYKTLWNLNCHCLSKEGSLVHSIAQSFDCPIAHTEIFAKGHSNLDLVQRFLPELVLRGRQVLLGRICSVNLLSCYWRDNVSRVCRSDLFIRRLYKEGDLWAPRLLKWKGKLVLISCQQRCQRILKCMFKSTLPSQPKQAGEQVRLWDLPSTPRRWGTRPVRRRRRSADQRPKWTVGSFFLSLYRQFMLNLKRIHQGCPFLKCVGSVKRANVKKIAPNHPG